MNKSLRLMIVFCLIFILSLTIVSAISVRPPSNGITYEPGVTRNVSFSVGDANKVAVSIVNSSISSNAELLTPSSLPDCNSARCVIKVAVTIPDMAGDPGRKHIYVNAAEEYVSLFGGAGATVGVLGTIYFDVPYEGKHLGVTVEPYIEGVQEGDNGYFTVVLTNNGAENIEKITGNVTIFPFGSSIAETVIELDSYSNLASTESTSLYATWNTTGVYPGHFIVVANISYDGEIATDRFPGFTVGQELIEAYSFEPEEVYSGLVQNIEVKLRSHWNENLKVYVIGKVLDSSGDVLAESTSETITNAPNDYGYVNLFLDLTDVSTGNYTLEMTSYFNGYSDTKNFNLSVIEQTEGLVFETAPLPKGNGSSSFNPNLLVSASIIFVVLVLILVLFFVLKKKKGGSNDYGSEESSEDDF